MSTKVRRNVPRNNRGRSARPTGRKHGTNGNSSRPANAVQALHKAKQAKDKYLALAQDSMSTGDRVQAESHYQHVDHYVRIINSLTQEKEEADARRLAAEKAREASTQNTAQVTEEVVLENKPETKPQEVPVALKVEEKKKSGFLPDFLKTDA